MGAGREDGGRKIGDREDGVFGNLVNDLGTCVLSDLSSIMPYVCDV